MEPCNVGGAFVVNVCVCRGVWQMQVPEKCSKMPLQRLQLWFFSLWENFLMKEMSFKFNAKCY